MKLKNIILSAVPVLAAMMSCSDWTETRPVDYGPGASSTVDFEALRAFKSGEHRIVMAGMRGTSGYPSSRGYRPLAMPDSVDYICFEDYEELHSEIIKEIAEVRSLKGTRSIGVVGYPDIEALWTAEEDRRAENGLPEGTADEFAAFVRKRCSLLLEACDRAGMDGVEAWYIGNLATAAAKAGQAAFLETISGWHRDNPDKEMFFKGYAFNVADKSFLEACRYIIISAEGNVTPAEMRLAVKLQCSNGVPVDRMVMEVTVPSTEEPDIQTGATPEQCASWILTPEKDFEKVGLSIRNASDEYFLSHGGFPMTAAAIRILNE